VLKFQLVALFLTAGTLVSPAWQRPTQGMPRGLTTPPIVTATDAPAGTEALPVTWVKVAVPDLGVMRAAIARPSGPGPFPAVLVLHGTHGFARQYVEWANDLARGGFIAVAGCWFSGGGGAGANDRRFRVPKSRPWAPVSIPKPCSSSMPWCRRHARFPAFALIGWRSSGTPAAPELRNSTCWRRVTCRCPFSIPQATR
jgi:hypothetical protein